MSRLRSLTDWTGTQFAGVILGDPATDGDWFVWGDHELLPDGVIDADGYIFVDEVTDAV